eukprot:GHRQ01026061.1.p1 GENE.GHRQ01026061.1~~GHRQ01026061.1.p1  ORF type:complete len:174 (-),score=34.51 GHRQ01026061.1:299-820(-)
MDSFKQSTLYSFLLMLLTLQDLPQVLQDKYGGFLSSKVQDDFLYYADTLFKHLGDIVDQWMTFNEVISICELGYQLDVFAPQANKGLGAKYTCGHNVLLAHAKTMQLYRCENLRKSTGVWTSAASIFMTMGAGGLGWRWEQSPHPILKIHCAIQTACTLWPDTLSLSWHCLAG